MAHTTVYLGSDDVAPPRVVCLPGADGATCFTLRVAVEVSILLRGNDRDAVASAHALAAVLTEAADALEQHLDRKEA